MDVIAFGVVVLPVIVDGGGVVLLTVLLVFPEDGTILFDVEGVAVMVVDGTGGLLVVVVAVLPLLPAVLVVVVTAGLFGLSIFLEGGGGTITSSLVLFIVDVAFFDEGLLVVSVVNVASNLRFVPAATVIGGWFMMDLLDAPPDIADEGAGPSSLAFFSVADVVFVDAPVAAFTEEDGRLGGVCSLAGFVWDDGGAVTRASLALGALESFSAVAPAVEEGGTAAAFSSLER